MAGGKGGSQTTTVEVPQYIEDAAKRNLARAQQISQIGFTPYYGPDVAALTPLQEASMRNLASTAGSFGLEAGDPMAGMPTAQTFAGGIRGYSSAPMFEEALDEFGRRRPAQKAYIDAMFIDPFSGEYTPVYQPVEPVMPVVPTAPSGPSVPTTPRSPTITADPYSVTERPIDIPIFTPETDPYGPTVSVPDVIDAREQLGALSEPLTVIDPVTQEEVPVLPPIIPAAGGLDPQVGDVIDNAELQARQNKIVADAFENFGAVLDAGQRGELTPEQVAAANPAFNPEIALANAATPVTIQTPEGSYTVPAGSLGSADFAAATGATYVPPETEGGLGSFVGGGTGDDVADIMEQYNLAGQSAAAAGIRNIGGAYAQSPAGSGDLVETRYDPVTGQSEIIGVTSTAEDTLGADLFRSLTDPNYDPEGTVLSRALGGLLTPSTQSARAPQTLGEFVQAAPQMGMTATEAATAYQQSRQESSASQRREREAVAERNRGEVSAALEIAKNPDAYKNLGKTQAKQAVRDLGLPAYDDETSREVLKKLTKESAAIVAIDENPDAYKNLNKTQSQKALKDLGVGNYDKDDARDILQSLVRKVEAQ